MTAYYDACPECGGEKIREARLCRSCFRRPANPIELILGRVVAHEATGCLLYLGTRNDSGYGMVHWGGRKNMQRKRAHRVMYEAFVGPIPEGLVLDHLCRVRHCVNPAHLEVVTNTENVLRGESVIARNARKTACVRGHELSGDNLYVRPGGSRECRECIRMKWRERYHARRAAA